MVLEPVHCPKCDNIDVVKNGKSRKENSVTFVVIKNAVAARLSSSIPIVVIYQK